MDDFEALLAPPRAASPPAAGRAQFIVPPAVQASRDDERVRVLQDELAKTTNPLDRAAIGRELARAGVPAAPPQQQAQQAAPAQPKGPDPFEQLLTTPVTASTPKVTPRPEPKPAPDYRQSAPISVLGIDLDQGKAALSQVTGAAGSIAGGLHGLYTLATTGDSNAAAESVRKTQDALTYRPEEGTMAAHYNDALASNANPLTWIPKASDWAGEKVAEVTGSPALGAAVNVAGNVLGPGAVMKGARSLPLRSLVARDPLAVEARIEPRLADIPSIGQPQVNPTQLPPVTRAAAETVPRGAAVADAGPPVQSNAAAGVFPESIPDSGVRGLDLPRAEQLRRAAVMREIGLEQPRQSAITGNPKAAADDAQAAKYAGKAGDRMTQGELEERGAITNYAERIVNETGGSTAGGQEANYGRGHAIAKPLDALRDYFDERTSTLYKEADMKAQGVPTELDKFRTVLGNDAEISSANHESLRKAIQAQAKNLNIIGDDGRIFSNGHQAEAMRKYLGDKWTPETGKFVGKLKDALDEDILSSAGESVYGPARALWREKKETLDNPNGIAKIMDSSGPINRSVPFEKIPDTITRMPVDQLGHIVNTLKNSPESIRPQATQALNEIKAHYARQIADVGSKQQGQWNSVGVRNFLRDNSGRMKLVFTPTELEKFATLNDAGNILKSNKSYPGAHAQSHNIVQMGVVNVPALAAGSVGAALGGPLAGAGAAFLGRQAGSAMADAMALAKANKRFVKVSDLLDKGGLK